MHGRVVPWWQPELAGGEAVLIDDVLRSGFVNDGPMTSRFESELSAIIGTRHAICVTSGTAALYLSLVALGVGPMDEVIVPDLTFIATANAVRMTGAEVVLVDVDPDTLMLSAASLKFVTSRTRAIITVHVSGRSAPLKGATFLDIPIIEDACEGLGSSDLGRTGTLGCFSLSPNKIITTGQGGVVATDDDRLAQRLRQLKDQGRDERDSEFSPALGFNFKFTDIQAAYGMGQLASFEERRTHLRLVNQWYRSMLSDVVEFPEQSANDMPLWTDILIDRRDECAAYLRSQGYGTRRFWPPMHTQPRYRTAQSFPVAEAASRRGLWLPSSFGMREEDVHGCARAVRDFLRGRG